MKRRQITALVLACMLSLSSVTAYADNETETESITEMSAEDGDPEAESESNEDVETDALLDQESEEAQAEEIETDTEEESETVAEDTETESGTVLEESEAVADDSETESETVSEDESETVAEDIETESETVSEEESETVSEDTETETETVMEEAETVSRHANMISPRPDTTFYVPMVSGTNQFTLTYPEGVTESDIEVISYSLECDGTGIYSIENLPFVYDLYEDEIIEAGLVYDGNIPDCSGTVTENGFEIEIHNGNWNGLLCITLVCKDGRIFTDGVYTEVHWGDDDESGDDSYDEDILGDIADNDDYGDMDSTDVTVISNEQNTKPGTGTSESQPAVTSNSTTSKVDSPATGDSDTMRIIFLMISLTCCISLALETEKRLSGKH